ncbi:Flp pilus assembly protein CpaB [Salirhabdus salicampi]|uniref:Flp pilus assembly protein CpaB n=1 Tax=Salirhabdus salicampi TaxID=476102 RepID=UPI0020C20435|nr:Flp pilus assembly protein CpaB [Salirhabdus salicampi]MCP8616133.1 Flp pilus assembly protein CpaB [Salirhabdus salicampi]
MKGTRKLWIISTFLGFIMATLLYIVLQTGSVEESLDETDEQDVTNTTDDKGLDQNEEDTEGIEEVEEGQPRWINNRFDVSEGKRAISIPVSDPQGVSGFIQKGDYVDIVADLPAPKGNKENVQILLQNVKVLATGYYNNIQVNDEEESQEEQRLYNHYNLITLEVSPKEGAALSYVVEEANFYTLMLRNTEDKDVVEHFHINLDQIYKGVIQK